MHALAYMMPGNTRPNSKSILAIGALTLTIIAMSGSSCDIWMFPHVCYNDRLRARSRSLAPWDNLMDRLLQNSGWNCAEQLKTFLASS